MLSIQEPAGPWLAEHSSHPCIPTSTSSQHLTGPHIHCSTLLPSQNHLNVNILFLGKEPSLSSCLTMPTMPPTHDPLMPERWGHAASAAQAPNTMSLIGRMRFDASNYTVPFVLLNTLSQWMPKWGLLPLPPSGPKDTVSKAWKPHISQSFALRRRRLDGRVRWQMSKTGQRHAPRALSPTCSFLTPVCGPPSGTAVEPQRHNGTPSLPCHYHSSQVMVRFFIPIFTAGTRYEYLGDICKIWEPPLPIPTHTHTPSPGRSDQ